MINIIPEISQFLVPFSIKNSVVIGEGLVLVNGEKMLEDKALIFDDFVRLVYQKTELKYPKFFKMDAVAKLAMLGAHLSVPSSNSPNTAVLLANAHATHDSDLAHYQSIQDRNNYFPSPSVFAYTLPNIAAGEICIKYQFKGENIFFVMDKPDWRFLVNYTKDLFENTDTQACLLAWVDVALPHYQLAMFWIEKR